MTETTNEIQNIYPNPAITLRENLNSHMSDMIDRAFRALEMLTWIQDDVDKKMVEIIGAKTEVRGISQNTIVVEKARETTDPLMCNDSLWLKDFNTFLCADVKDPISSGTVGVQFFMSVGIRYYFERIKDKDFFIMSDLPEMLSVDRKMNELITACVVLVTNLPRVLTDKKRQHKARLGKKKGPDGAWIKVRAALIDLNNTLNKESNQKEKKWAISAIANEIHKKVGCTPNTVILYFKNHFSKDITGKKNSKKNYYISDLINMIDNQ